MFPSPDHRLSEIKCRLRHLLAELLGDAPFCKKRAILIVEELVDLADCYVDDTLSNDPYDDIENTTVEYEDGTQCRCNPCSQRMTG